MGQLIYLVNHTLKQYVCPIAKFGEFLANKSEMVIFIELLRECWNNCQIEIMMELSDRMEILKEYKELDWKTIRRVLG